jgi:ribosomal protein S27E
MGGFLSSSTLQQHGLLATKKRRRVRLAPGRFAFSDDLRTARGGKIAKRFSSIFAGELLRCNLKQHERDVIMDLTFKCPNCDQELEVDASGAGSEIECPACSKTIVVPVPAGTVTHATGSSGAPAPAAPPKEEKHFSVPVHEKAAEALIQKPNRRPLEIIAKEGDKTVRIRTIKRSDCQEVGKDHFDETVSNFLEKVGHANIVSVHTINYSFMELGTRNILMDYGVLIVFKG